MKIAVITPWSCRCGIFTYSRNLTEALAQLGVESYIIRLPRFGALTPEMLSNMVRSIPVDEIDLILCEHEYGLYKNLEGGFFGDLAKLSKPLVTTMHATGLIWDTDRVISDASKKVIVHNEFMAKHYPHPSVIIPHGCLTLQPSIPKTEALKSFGVPINIPIVGYCGYISQQKGLETLIQAMTKVPKVALLIAGGWFVEGDTKYIEMLKAWSLKVLAGRCQWLGYIEDEKLASIYSMMDIIVYPARGASESGALLMALSHGKPVIASPLPPFKEKSKHIMIFKNTKDLSKKIKLLLSDRMLFEEQKEKSKKYVEENSWLKVAEKHLSLFKHILKEG